MSPAPALVKFWQTDLTRQCFLVHTTQEDRQALRLVCRDFAETVAPILFAEIRVSFSANSFTRPTRMTALRRIGHHCHTLIFSMPHTPNTFLPPLLDPVTGVEQDFVYYPQHQRPISRSGDSQFGSRDVTDLLVRQYPPLFHAATNIPSFIQALEAIPRLHHLHVSCPGQSSAERYRRSVVDYALISLRVAIEQTLHPQLTALTLSPIHPSAIFYLRPLISFGCLPNSLRAWRKITHLTIHMESFPSAVTTYDPKSSCTTFSTASTCTNTSVDHLKALHSYLPSFPSLTHFAFRWIPLSSGNGTSIPPGPFPLTLSNEPCLTPIPPFGVSTTCPKSCSRPLRSLLFRRLVSISLENALVDAHQIATFIRDHRRTIREADFSGITLRSGDWDTALAPLTNISGSEDWKTKSSGGGNTEYGDIPIQLGMSPRVAQPKGIGKAARGIEEEETVDFFPAPEDDVGGAIHRLKYSRAYSTLQRAGWRTKEALIGRATGCGQEHTNGLKRFLRGGVFGWR